MKGKRRSLFIRILGGVLGVFLMASCGGGGGGGGPSGGMVTPQVEYTVSGNAYDDLLDGATITFYLPGSSTSLVQVLTNADGNYSAKIKANEDVKMLYSQASGGKLATTGEEFNGRLEGFVPLTDADSSQTIESHLNPVTSMIKLYLSDPNSLDEAINSLNSKLQQIDNTITPLTRQSLSNLSQASPLVKRISNLIQYQIDPQDTDLRTIDQVMAKIVNNQIDMPGLRASLTLAQQAAEHGKGEISGRVKDLYTDDPIPGATVRLLNTAFWCRTDLDGNFFFRQLPASFDLIVDVSAPGYAGNQAITRVSPAKGDQGIIIKLKAVTSRVEIDLNSGVNARYNARTREFSDGTLQIATPDKAMVITLTKKNLNRIRGRLAEDSRYSRRYNNGSPSIVYINITPVDPTTEIEVFPGDFTTNDPNAAGTPDSREKKLESVVLGEFSLQDEAGNPINLSDLVEEVEVRLRLPESLQSIYREKYDLGERFIPWYAYNRGTGIWEVAKNPSQLILIDNVLYAVATADHFSWWNVDQPIETRGCIKGRVFLKDGVPAPGITVQANGIDYQGGSSAITDAAGYYQLMVKREAMSKVTAQFGEYGVSSDGVYVSELVNCPSGNCCQEVNLTFNLIDICGQVKDHLGNRLHGAYVYASTGVGRFTDKNGDFGLMASQGRTITLKASYTRDGVNYYANKEIEIGDQELCQEDKVLMTMNLAKKHIRGKVRITENNLQKILTAGEVKIAASNGFTTTNKADGSYDVEVEQNAKEITISYRYCAVDGSYVEERRTITWNDDNDQLAREREGLSRVDINDQNDVDISFVIQPVTIYGTITNLAGLPIANVRVSTRLGKYTISDAEGKYELPAPANTTLSVVATFSNPKAKILRDYRQEISTSLSEVSANFENIDDRLASIYGQVREVEAGRFLPGVLVISNSGDSDLTDPNGQFSLIVPAEAVVKVNFTSGDYRSQPREFNTPSLGQDLLVHDPNSLHIELAKINHQPVIKNVDLKPAARLCPGDELTLEITAFDIDANTILSYTVESNPPVEQDSNAPQKFTWIAPSTPGVYPFTIQVQDGQSQNSTARLKVRAEVRDCSVVIPNRSPVIMSLTPQKEIKAILGQSKELAVVAYDPDADPLAYQWRIFKKTNPASRYLLYDPNNDLSSDWISNPNARIAKLVVPDVFDLYDLDANQPQYFAACITVTDGKDGLAEKELGIEVSVNQPPVILEAKVSPGQCILGESVTLQSKAEDPQGIASIIWYLGDQVIGESLNTSYNPTFSSSLNWTPTDPDTHVGSLDLKLVVKDKHPTHPFSTSQYRRLVVGDNKKPNITLSPKKTYLIPGETTQIEAIVIDPERKPLTYQWLVSDGNISSGQGTSQITWGSQTTGDYKISLMVRDGFNTVTTDPNDLIIHVVNLTLNAPPNQALILETGMLQVSVALEAEVGISPASEPYRIEWQVKTKPDGATANLNPTNSLNTVFTANRLGTYHLGIKATMTNTGYAVEDEVIIEVREKSTPNVFGYVRDEQQNPIAGALVEIYDPTDRGRLDRQTITDTTGYYEFTDIPPGTYWVVVARDGYLERTAEVEVE